MNQNAHEARRRWAERRRTVTAEELRAVVYDSDRAVFEAIVERRIKAEKEAEEAGKRP